EHRPTKFSYAVEKSPLFGDAPDWRFRLTNSPERAPILQITDRNADSLLPSESVVAQKVLGEPFSVKAIRNALHDVHGDVEFVHILDSDCRPIGELWIEDCLSLFDIFPKTAVLGGRIHNGGQIISAGYVYGFGQPIWCPDKGRDIRDSGYFAQMWKPRSVASV